MFEVVGAEFIDETINVLGVDIEPFGEGVVEADDCFDKEAFIDLIFVKRRTVDIEVDLDVIMDIKGEFAPEAETAEGIEAGGEVHTGDPDSGVFDGDVGVGCQSGNAVITEGFHKLHQALALFFVTGDEVDVIFDGSGNVGIGRNSIHVDRSGLHIVIEAVVAVEVEVDAEQ